MRPLHLKDDNLTGLLRVAAVGVVWGTIPLVIRASDGASIVKVFYRVIFAGITILTWMALTGRLRQLTGLGWPKVRQLLAQGALLTVNWVLFLTALDWTKVAVAELLAYTGPVFVAFLAPFVTGERFERRILIPLALALTGIVVIMVPHGLTVGTGREFLGAVMAFVSALTYAGLLLRSKRLLRGVSVGALMMFEYAIAAVLLLPFALMLPGPSTPQAFGALVTLGIVQTAGTGLVFISALRVIRTDHAAILTYAEPVSAVVFAALFLREPLNAMTIIGGAFVVAAGVFIARMRPTDAIVSTIEAPSEVRGDDEVGRAPTEEDA